MTYDNFTIPVEVPGAKEWMELLCPDDGTQVLLGYDHAAYAPYAAATCHTWGEGKAAYIGTMLENAALDNLLERLLPQMGIGLGRYRWPLIVKQGSNEDGETITYLLNYSSECRRFPMEKDGMELLSRKPCKAGGELLLSGWGAAIVCTEG